MASSKVAVSFNAVCGKILSFLGYCIEAFLLIGLIAYISMGENVAAVVCLLFMAIFSLFIITGIKIKRAIKRFNKYFALISNNTTSIDIIAMQTSQSVDFVRKDLQKMIDKKFFVQTYIDNNTNEIVVSGENSAAKPVSHQPPNAEMTAISCANCGAVNQIVKGGSANCEYCGSPMK